MKILPLFLALALMACTDRRDPPRGALHVIQNDPGGQIISAIADRKRLERWGGPIEIRGFCNSACTIFTTLPNACLAPDARIGFHSSNVNVEWVGNPQIAEYLRGGILNKFLTEWQFVPFTDMHRISAQDYVRLDPQTRLCAR